MPTVQPNSRAKYKWIWFYWTYMSVEQKTPVQESGFLPHERSKDSVNCERCGRGTVVWDAELEKSACDRCGKVYAPPSV